MTDVRMPELGETITQGTIPRWFKEVGDTVAVSEALFEVSTEKVDAEVPSPLAGTITKILIGLGETVDVGTIVAEIDAVGSAPSSVTASPAPPVVPEEPQTVPSSTAAQPPTPAPPAPPAPPVVEAAPPAPPLLSLHLSCAS